ncbi:LOW QUALITY PROTEIN: protein GFS12-like [Durio zibethinus]|uniref:LOW QUALITY PROTEIN: protein GFS12-like n=1 Tax=Durio zibethinus TaxID=66656 RepID=A0A6P6A7K1_DURZI|nr:LOW QUALITY PROTEIN: protein GFS12-like [Durio zibethinus]
MEEKETCLECLERRIKSDWSDQLLFCYGISDSPLPFGSSAVVQFSDNNSAGQVSSSSSASASTSQFILSYLPTDPQHCLSKYLNQYMMQNGEETEVSAGTSNTNLSDSLLGETQFLSNRMGYECCACNHSAKFSCLRTIPALAPLAHVGISSYSAFQDLASSLKSGNLEDHILSSLNLFIQQKASGRDSVNYMRLLGVPSFDETSIPGCLRHPNIAPILGLVKTPGYINLLLPKTPYTLENILHYSPNALKSDWHVRFLMYQLLSALSYLHGLGVHHGNLCPSNVMLTNSCWVWLRIWDNPRLGFNLDFKHGKSDTSCAPSRVGCCIEGCSSQGLYADFKLSPSSDWNSQFTRWWRGELSNFEYLLFLNKLAGRRWGDHTFHPVMPWVIDFSTKPSEDSDSGWRDLSKSKWRLAKGDEQLDFTYSTSEVPHHVSDECLSELAVCSYKARRLPLSVLRMAVRSVYEPNEYPSTMQRLYQWTPDECIPEFYCDPRIFYSQHSGMNDLAVPSWAGSPEEFIKLHRDALESNRVSCQIHHWIDITFGYKMLGPAAVAAKNVMLSSSESTKARSIGRRQLFTQPHPARRVAMQETRDSAIESAVCLHQANEMDNEKSFLYKTACLQELEEVSLFSEHARHLSPLYCYGQENLLKQSSSLKVQSENLDKSASNPHHISNYCGCPSDIDLNYLLEHIEIQDDDSTGYQEFLLWRQKSFLSRSSSKEAAMDIFSVGCLLAELYLKRPLFDSSSLAMYLESGVFPGLIQELPSHAKVLVEACIGKNWMRRPSAKSLLESPYFPSTVKSVYLFTVPLQLMAKDGSQLQFAANFAKQGALKAMGTLAAEMCAPYCLPLASATLSDAEAEWAYVLLKEFIKCLTPKAVKASVLPAIQKILQTTGYSHLKVSLLQDSFVREIWNQIGKQAYLETIHPLVISNLYISPHKSSAAAASVLLICSSEELGVPITVHQTILPLIQCFGKGLCPDGIDVLVRIGGLLGETFIVRQMLPLLKHVARSCIDVSCMNKPEPVHSWSSLALIDCLMTLDGLVAFLPREAVVKDLIEDKSCLHVLALMQRNLEMTVLQVGATTLMAICQRIGPELTALHVLPQLKELFDELAFSQESSNASGSLGKSLKVSKSKVNGEFQIESRMDLVLLLYPSFASLLGIEKLRQCCATWLLLEQFLLRFHNWKWEYTGESPRSGVENLIAKVPLLSKGSTSDYGPAKLLLNGVGWSIPQSQGIRGAKNLMPQRHLANANQSSVQTHETASNHFKREPWFWFPTPAAGWDGSDLVGRFGSPKDEFPWKIRASVLSSVRAHQGALRSLAVCQDENTVFTAGIGPGFKGTVQKWDLTRINCVSGYYGHEEVVNDICILSLSGRIASCDGTIHVWNGQTGKLISIFSEPSTDSLHLASPLSSPSKISADHVDMLNSNTLSSGVLSSPFDGSLYTCMHYLEHVEKVVVGTGNGSLRFIDVSQGRKLHLWKGEFSESAFPSLVSAICSCGSDKEQGNGVYASPRWTAAGLSSGHCRLFDVRSGNVIACWRAHDGYVTKLAAPEEHLLVSSSLDKTLRIWDLRRNLPEPVTFKGHSDGISGFSLWGQDVISISRNKIGLSSLAKSADEDGQHRVIPQKLYSSDNGSRNMSVLSSISIIPFSRLFVVGTEDGYLRICC